MNPISKLKDLCGQKFGLLTVICRVDSHIGRDGRSRVKWLCECIRWRNSYGDRMGKDIRYQR